MKHRCPRTLDKSILMFGLEIEEVGILGLVGGMGSLLIGPLLPGMLLIGLWVVFLQFKKNKPAGHLIHWLYEQGMDLPGLIVPVKKAQYYGIFRTTNSIKKV